MLASLNWIKEYVEVKDTPEVLADKLTRAGVAVELINYLGQDVKDVVTGKVVELERHPNSDHLWICSMDIGGEEILQILTGAQNVTKNAIVPVAIVGSELPGGMKLKKVKMRGLDSFGMLCSATELGIDGKLLLASQRDGILILPSDTPIGVDIRTVLGLDDIVFDFDLTANRSDCFNIVGLAREISTLTGAKLIMPDLTVKEEAGGKASDMMEVDIVAKDLCSRFASRIIKDIKIGPSPEWMQKRLRACGVRPISNVVDTTNYVMLELGQPMHAYDYDKVCGHKLIVRRAENAEKLVTLDDQERELNDDMITIADTKHAIGLGGVMGGLETEVTDETKTVIFEAATFKGVNIRRTSRALNLRSEASGRFERGVDTASTIDALDRACNLLEGMGACKTVSGIVEDYPVKYEPTVVTVSPKYITTRIGCEISTKRIIEILEGLGFGVKSEGENLLVTAPTWRNDVEVSADISEEIARIHGMDNIKSHLPIMEVSQGSQDISFDLDDAIKDYMVGVGLTEVMTYSFINPSAFDKILLAKDDEKRKVIEILNPITDEFKVMRTTLVPGILSTASYNIAHKNNDVAIFEVSRVFEAKELPLKDFPKERMMLSVLLSGKKNELNWNEAKDNFDFFDLKGIAEGLVQNLNLKKCKFVEGTRPYLHPGKSCAIQHRGKVIGYFGEVHPTVEDNYNLGQASYILEIDIEGLANDFKLVPKYSKLPKFPGSSRDIALVVPSDVTNQEIVKVIRKNGGKLLQDIKVFDIYTGKQVEKGFKSVAYNLTFQAQNKTLVDQEVDEAVKFILNVVSSTFKAKLRD